MMLADAAVLPMLIRVTQDIVSPNITGYAGQRRRHPPHPLHVPEEIGAPHENDKGPGAIPGLFLFSEAAAPCRR
jgi:hypothetical protein